MLNWGIAFKPRFTKPGEFKQRVEIFKNYVGDALFDTKIKFSEEFHQRVNPSTGTHMKSNRVLALLNIRHENVVTEKDTRTVISLEGDSTTLAIAHINEFGGIIRPKSGKLLTIPKHLNPAMSGKARSITNAKWVQLSGNGNPALVRSSTSRKPRKSRSAVAPRKPRSARLAKSDRQEFNVLYWGKTSVRIKPKHFFRDTSIAVKQFIKEKYPRALRRAWDAMWTS